jgi:hypothetical protein
MVTTLILLVFRATTTMGFSSPNQVLLGTGSAAVAAGQTPCELFDGLLLVVNDTKQEVEAIVYNLRARVWGIKFNPKPTYPLTL